MFPSAYYPVYRIHFPKYWFGRDKPSGNIYFPAQKDSNRKELFFHLAQNDYLSTLATVLRFFEETINDNKTTPEMRELQLKSIKGVINDLLYLNKHYVVVPKDQSKMD